MKRRVALLAFAAVLATACKSGHEPAAVATPIPTPQAQPAQAGSGAPLGHPLFWAIDKIGDKAGVTTYLLGTMHVGVDADSQLPRLVWDRFHAAPTFAMEADLDAAAASELFKPTASSLHTALGDAYWKKLQDAMGAGMADAVDHMPPMVPASELSMRGLPRTAPMDKVLAGHATAEHKRMVFLEPAARQLALLAKWFDVKALKLLLDELPQTAQRAHAMIDAYVSGDERTLLALTADERDDALHHGYTAAEYDAQMTELLYDRNASWIDAIEQLHTAGGGFVAVGALHLLGAHSVLDLLTQRGYRVTRLAP